MGKFWYIHPMSIKQKIRVPQDYLDRFHYVFFSEKQKSVYEMIPFKKISRVPKAPICLYVTTAHICCDLYVIMCVEKIIKPVFKLRQMLGGVGSYGVKNQSNMEN